MKKIFKSNLKECDVQDEYHTLNSIFAIMLLTRIIQYV